MTKAKIIEIFCSIQGEGLWIGRTQVFVRFYGCKLKCSYCDTPLTHHKIFSGRIEDIPFTKKFRALDLELTKQELTELVSSFKTPSIALTGGEPLEQSAFLKEWLPSIHPNNSILLETSGVEVKAMAEVTKWVDLVSMDLKLNSSSLQGNLWSQHKEFIDAIGSTDFYLKVVYDDKITNQEEEKLAEYANQYDVPMILQPVMPLRHQNREKLLNVFRRLSLLNPRIVLIPQTHKFLGIL